ncbi:MAG: DUF4960 domain-containing protein [Prevotellaceae bacterium]|jgi:hypothetical protein|nr:DUF4960 domain-containing protein [Prevotellaceae bacterium]
MNKKLFFAIFTAMFLTSIVNINAQSRVAIINGQDDCYDDDEIAAKTWLVSEYGGDYLPISTVYNDPAILNNYAALWIMDDDMDDHSNGYGGAGTNLPSGLWGRNGDDVVRTSIIDWYKAGGNLLLTSFAYQYLVNDLGRVPDPFNRGMNISENDYGYMQTFFGREVAEISQTFNHSLDPLFAGLTTTHSNMTFNGISNCAAFPLVDAELSTEKHICFWHSDFEGYNNTNPGKYAAMYAALKVTPLATLDGIGDYYGAGIARWDAWGDYQGKAITIGLGNYEWHQENNPYQANIERLTKNALDELSGKWKGANAEKVAFVHIPATIEGLTDDDERAAAEWFVNCYGGDYLPFSSLDATTLANYNAIWLMWDKDGTGNDNLTPNNGLPSEYLDIAKNAIIDWYKAGGNLFATNYATQYLYNDLGRMPQNDAVYSRGYHMDNTSGGAYIQTYFGRTAVPQTFNHSLDPLFAGMTDYITFNTNDVNGVENCRVYQLLDNNKPMEKHNCAWHSDMVDYNNQNTGKYTKMYEVLSVTPLATFDNIGDYYGGGIARWDAWNDFQGKAITVGLGTYEWNQSGGNIYVDNIRQLTYNALEELKLRTLEIPADETRQATDYTGYGNIIFHDGSQLTGANNLTVNGVVKVVKTFDTDQWYPIGFPFDIDNISIKQGANVYIGAIYDHDNGENVVPSPSNISLATTDNIYLATYDGAADKFKFAGELGQNIGYVIVVPNGGFEGGNISSGTVEVTFTSVNNPTLNSAGATIIADGYNLVANPDLINAASLPDANDYYQYNYSVPANFERVNANTLSTALKPFEAIVTYKGDTSGTMRSSLNIGGTDVVTALPGIAKDAVVETQYYNLQGMKIAQPQRNQIYLIKSIYRSGVVRVSKSIIR